MTEHEQRHAAYLEQVRAKYDADQLKALKAKGHTFPGGTSYPVDDLDDLAKAVKAVGRGGADHDAIRKYVIGRAKALGASDQIPDSWNADGSLKSANSADPAAPVKCATCDGSGKIMDGNRKCPDCNGPGEQRSRPTSEDYTVSEGLKNAKQALAGVKADQLADPDNKTDPDDGAVMAAIEKAEAALDEAIVAQGKDGKYEPEPARSANPATAKRAFSSLIERPPAHKGEFQVRMDDGENENATTARFVGYASTTGVPYSVRDWLGEYQETILPGAFAKTLREQSNVPLLFNHDGIPLASTASGTSRLSEDKTGLRNEADLDRRDAVTNSVCVQLSRGVLDKMSFSFAAVKDSWNEAYDDRGVSEARLYDSSIVTFPANPTTTAELRDSIRSALGREGRSLWLADSEMSVRSALPVIVERRELDTDAEDLLERALRALAHADEIMCRSHGPHGRARTFQVAAALVELRAGKALSTKNHQLITTALDALSAADKHHAKLVKQHAAAADALNSVLDQGQDGTENGTPPGNGNPTMPQDGAGPRSKALKLARERETELRKLRGR